MTGRSSWPALALLGVLAVVLVRTAWVCDDAYITFRVVDNFVHGYGPRWNVLERVQTYTHPLWFLVMSAAYAVTREPYFTSIALSVGFTLGAVWILGTSVAVSARSAVIALALCLFSKAFVDFSTSGLENALTNLLLVLLFFNCWTAPPSTRTVGRAMLIGSLLMLNRLDLGLIAVPCVASLAFRVGIRRSRWELVLGLTPLVAWETFSIVYYGFPFPNTAYAKLQTGVPELELARQGLRYLSDSLRQDPLTLVTIGLSSVLAIAGPTRRTWPLGVGVLLYTAYVVWVGGDFMSGRFLVTPFVCAVLQLAAADVRLSEARAWIVVGAAAAAALLAPVPSVLTGGDFRPDPTPNFSDFGISDVRRFYYPSAGLLRVGRAFQRPKDKSYDLGEEARANGTRFMVVKPAGFVGYAAGPQVHLVDVWALGDPLLARLPARVGRWSIGHFSRTMPENFEATLMSGVNSIPDEGVAAYYEKIRLITRAPIWSVARWKAIYRMNTGQYEHLIRYSSYYSVDTGKPRARQP